jgi:hypothetical protein
MLWETLAQMWKPAKTMDVMVKHSLEMLEEYGKGSIKKVLLEFTH